MNLLNDSEMAFATEYIKIIEQIVVTSACSCIPPKYTDGLKNINSNRKYTQCITCNSSIFLATNALYKDYIYSKQRLKEIEDNKQSESKNIEKPKTTRTRTNKTKE